MSKNRRYTVSEIRMNTIKIDSNNKDYNYNNGCLGYQLGHWNGQILNCIYEAG